MISLCRTSFSVFPQSHLHSTEWADIGWNCGKKQGYYELNSEDLKQLEAADVHELSIPADIGDVLIMKGGVVVHGSQAVPPDSEPRFMAYAHYRLA